VTAYPPIPEDGLAEVLRAWTGRGSLWDALAVPLDVEDHRKWSARDIQLRAHRVLFERIIPHLEAWPTRVNVWIDLLPAARTHERVVKDVPFSGVSWAATRARFGWPPKGFVGREAERRADMLLVTTLRWTLDRLLRVRQDAVRAFPDIGPTVSAQLDAASRLLNIDPVASASGSEPRNPELLALRREGAPWGAVATIAEELRDIENSVEHLIDRLILPDDEIRWRLFHLAVLGRLLVALRSCGCTIKSLRPLSAGTSGPAYSIVDQVGRRWELWFEASGIWSHRGVTSPYTEATRGCYGAGRALGADLMLVRGDVQALIFECKYSNDQEVVARGGYYQAMTYATETRARLVEKVTSYAIGPEGVVRFASSTATPIGVVGTSPPSGMQSIIQEVFDLPVDIEESLQGQIPMTISTDLTV
jgi:hypothetical protein